MISEKTTGLMVIILAILLIILYAVFPNLVAWLYFIFVAVLFIYGLYLWLTKD